MEQNYNPSAPTQTFTLADILRMFRGKGKAIIAAVIVSAIIGAIIGCAFSFVFVSYGGTVTFYISPAESSNALLPLLNSDSFAEKLLLDENGLPPKEDCNESDYNAALEAVKTFNEARTHKYNLRRHITMYNSDMTIISSKYSELEQTYTSILAELKMYLSAQDEVAKTDEHAEAIAKYEKLRDEAKAELDKYKVESFLPAQNESIRLQTEMVKATRAVNDARDAANLAVEKVLADWRAQPEVKELVAKIRASVTCEYDKLVDNVKSNSVSENEDNKNTAFLIFNVSIENDEETADFIIERIKARAPYYIKTNIERITDATDIQISLTSTFADTHVTDGAGLVVSTAVGAVACAVVVFVVIFLVVIIKGLLPPDVFEKREKKEKNKVAKQAE